MIEFAATVGVKQTVGSHNVRAFLRHVAEQTLDECLRPSDGMCAAHVSPDAHRQW